MMKSPADTLYTAKRQLDKARDVIGDLLRKSPYKRETDAWMGLYYFFPTSANLGTFEKRVAAFTASLSKEPGTDFSEAVANVRKHYALVATAKANLETARRQRKAKLAAKAEQKSALGIDLKKKGGARATPETYSALRAGLKPVEIQLANWISARIQTEYEATVEQLQAADWVMSEAFPHRDRAGNLIAGSFVAPDRFTVFFELKDRTTARRKHGVDVAATAARLAASEADAALADFCAKLAGKVDGAIAEECAGAKVAAVHSQIVSDIWSNSVISVEIAGGRTQVWHTRVIWNRSIYDNEFKQWPTRRVNEPLRSQPAGVAEA